MTRRPDDFAAVSEGAILDHLAAAIAPRVDALLRERTEFKLLRPKEAAERLGVSRSHFYRLPEDGEIPFVSHSTMKMVDVRDLEDWAAARKVRSC